MASPIPLQTDSRPILGTRATRRLRDAGKLPAIVYGHGQDAVNVAVPEKLFRESLAKGAHVFELSIEGKTENALLKDVQYDHLGTHVIHVDFARVDLTEKVVVNVSVDLKGDAIGEKQGGILQQILSEIEVECVVTEIPSSIIFNVSGLKLDESVHVRDLQLPAGVTAITDGELIVAVCNAIKEEELAEGEGTTAEPEVIKKPGAEEGEAEAAK